MGTYSHIFHVKKFSCFHVKGSPPLKATLDLIVVEFEMPFFPELLFKLTLL